jgi:hypothetical protein
LVVREKTPIDRSAWMVNSPKFALGDAKGLN